MKPALTAEEWARVPINKEGICDYLDIMYGAFAGSEDVFPEPGGSSAQAMAALALYGQPFGFTREDVRACRRDVNAYVEDRDEMLRSLADRIEALLPPEG